jgi:TPR repeat protein
VCNPIQIPFMKILLLFICFFCYQNIIYCQIEESISEIEMRAKSGNSDAQLKLGLIYFYGERINQDKKIAFDLIEKSAKQSNTEAQSKLGDMYSFGEGTSKSYNKAFTWYRKCGENGNEYCQMKMGSFYYEGLGTKSNNEKSLDWYLKVANKGNAKIQHLVAMFYKDGIGVPIDKEKYIGWEIKSGENGNSDALYALGNFYIIDSDYKNSTKAFNCYKKSSDLGNIKADLPLGIMNYEGAISDRNLEKAYYLIKKAKENKVNDAEKTWNNFKLDSYSNNLKTKIDFKELNYGILSAENTKNYTILKTTDNIPLKKGNRFGVEFRINSEKNTKLLIHRKWVAPEIFEDYNGNITNEYSSIMDYPTNEELNATFIFEDNFELIEGEWKYQLYFMNSLIYERIFNVKK